MITFMSLACGFMTAIGTYLLFRRRLFDFLIGITLISHAVNLGIFVSTNPVSGLPPIISLGEETLAKATMDPVPQALILTAIVIGFGTVTLLAVLFRTSLSRSNIHNMESVEEGSN